MFSQSHGKMNLKRSRSLWFRSFHLGLDAAKWKQCADHWVGQIEGTRNLWSFIGVDLTTTVGPLWERGINSVNAIKKHSGGEKEKKLAGAGWAKSLPCQEHYEQLSYVFMYTFKLPQHLGLPQTDWSVLWTGWTPYSGKVKGGIWAEVHFDRYLVWLIKC